MDFDIFSHRYGYEIISNADESRIPFLTLTNVLETITEEEIIDVFQLRKKLGKKDKSLSKTLNQIIREKLTDEGWKKETYIFKGGKKNKSTKDWKVDFSYPDLFSVEVAFNHSSAITVNLLKPVLASELNHVEKEFQTKFGIIITATKELKSIGGFDNAIGTYEGYCDHTIPLMNQLTVPLVIVGLKSVESFSIYQRKEGNQVIGYIKMNETGQILSLNEEE